MGKPERGRRRARIFGAQLPARDCSYAAAGDARISAAADGFHFGRGRRTGWRCCRAGLRHDRRLLPGAAIAIGGGVSAFAIFEAGMLWVPRMPFVLARERYLPRALADLMASTATPWKSIVVCCAVYSMLLPLGFVALVVMDVFFYMSALALEMGALLKLRPHPSSARRTPGNRPQPRSAIRDSDRPDAHLDRHFRPSARHRKRHRRLRRRGERDRTRRMAGVRALKRRYGGRVPRRGAVHTP